MKLKIDNYIRYYDEEETGGKSFSVEFSPGYTCIVGPNGTGKTTMLHQIENFCNENHNEYRVVKFDNVREGNTHKFQDFLYSGRTDLIASIMCSSEGEGIIINLGEFATKCGRTAMLCKNENKKFVILIDGIDSGTSIDKIYEFRDYFIKTVMDHCSSINVEVYIIATANNYAMIDNGVDCISAINGKHKVFKGYKSFASFIMKNKKG